MRGRAGAARRGARGLRALGGARHADRHGHRHAPPARVRRATSWSATCRWRRWSTTCPLYDLEPEEPAEPVYAARRPRQLARTPAARHAARPARLGEHRDPSAGCSSSTTRSWARARCAGPRRPTPPCSGSRRRRRRAARSPCRSTATAGGWPAIRTRARSRRCSSAPRNLACVGAEPLGLTNCLNFGNPEKPHIAWQLTRAVEGLRDACHALGVPVVGGNVSLYNEGARGPDLPDPGRRHGRRSCPIPAAAPVGGVRARRATRSRWSARSRPSLAGSELEKLRGELADGAARRSTSPASGRGPRPRCARPCARAGSRPRTTSPRAASPARSPSAACRRHRRPRRPRPAAAPRMPDTAAVRRGRRAARSWPARPSVIDAAPEARSRLGEVGGERLRIDGLLRRSRWAELARALRRRAIPLRTPDAGRSRTGSRSW